MSERLSRKLGLEGGVARDRGLRVAGVLTGVHAGSTGSAVKGIERRSHSHTGLVAEDVGNGLKRVDSV